ncbi:hypothetical protein D9M71_368230 [compost metagenome]
MSGDAQQAAGLQAQAIHFGPGHLVEEDVRQHRTQAVPTGVLLHGQEEHLARQEAPEQLVAVLPFPQLGAEFRRELGQMRQVDEQAAFVIAQRRQQFMLQVLAQPVRAIAVLGPQQQACGCAPAGSLPPEIVFAHGIAARQEKIGQRIQLGALEGEIAMVQLQQLAAKLQPRQVPARTLPAVDDQLQRAGRHGQQAVEPGANLGGQLLGHVVQHYPYRLALGHEQTRQRLFRVLAPRTEPAADHDPPDQPAQ